MYETLTMLCFIFLKACSSVALKENIRGLSFIMMVKYVYDEQIDFLSWVCRRYDPNGLQ